ncbi:hypothetical protein NECID01_0465 [Nematocida sp. AWRm77]|nr:hypothetical protein NECID01_0465 [Nematocida sp. AWRm77]
MSSFPTYANVKTARPSSRSSSRSSSSSRSRSGSSSRSRSRSMHPSVHVSSRSDQRSFMPSSSVRYHAADNALRLPSWGDGESARLPPSFSSSYFSSSTPTNEPLLADKRKELGHASESCMVPMLPQPSSARLKDKLSGIRSKVNPTQETTARMKTGMKTGMDSALKHSKTCTRTVIWGIIDTLKFIIVKLWGAVIYIIREILWACKSGCKNAATRGLCAKVCCWGTVIVVGGILLVFALLFIWSAISSVFSGISRMFGFSGVSLNKPFVNEGEEPSFFSPMDWALDRVTGLGAAIVGGAIGYFAGKKHTNKKTVAHGRGY